MTADKKRDTLLLNLERLSKWHEHECLVADDQKAGFHHNAAASFITAAIQRIEATSSPSATERKLEPIVRALDAAENMRHGGFKDGLVAAYDGWAREAREAMRSLAAAPAPAQGEPASTTCPNCYGDGPHAECPLCKGSGYVTAPTAPVVEAGAKWQPIETAPKDGTIILAWCVHTNAKYAANPVKEGWVAPVVARWIDHHGGGWTWNGHAGEFTHWMPLPDAPCMKGEQS